MILCDREIQEALRQKRLFITPEPSGECFSSTSVDLTLAARIDEWNPPQEHQGLGVAPYFRPADPQFIYQEIEYNARSPKTPERNCVWKYGTSGLCQSN